MIPIHLTDIWTAAAVILGFQLTVFLMRISRELYMEEKRETVWLPVADIVNLSSMFVLVMGVFVLPIVGVIKENIVKYCFGLALLLFLGYPFALTGHYELYPGLKPKPRPLLPHQERNVLIIIGVFVLIYVLIAGIYIARGV